MLRHTSLIATCLVALCVLSNFHASKAYVIEEIYSDDQCTFLTTVNIWAENSCLQAVKRTCSVDGISTTQDFPSTDTTCSGTPTTTTTGNPQCTNRRKQYCQASPVPRGFVGVSVPFYVNSAWNNGTNCVPANTLETDSLATLYRSNYCNQRTSSSSFYNCIDGVPSVKTCSSVNDCSCTNQPTNSSTVCQSLGSLAIVAGCYTPSNTPFIPMPVAPPMAASPKAAPMASPVVAPVAAPATPSPVTTPRTPTRAPTSAGSTSSSFISMILFLSCSIAMLVL